MNRERLKRWRRFKRNRELRIIEYREERATISRTIATYGTERTSRK